MSKTARRKDAHKSYNAYKPFMDEFNPQEYAMCGRKQGKWKHEKEALASRGPDIMHFRAYKCDHCGWYHLTSKPRNSN